MTQPESTSAVDAALAEIQRGIQAVEDMAAPEQYARAMAIGVFADDINPSDPSNIAADSAGMVVIVYQGQIIHLSIADGYLSRPPREVTAVLNGVIFNAFAVWTAQYDRLFNHAKQVIEQRGETEGARHLRTEAGLEH